LQIEVHILDDPLLIAGEFSEAVGEGVGDAEVMELFCLMRYYFQQYSPDFRSFGNDNCIGQVLMIRKTR
jgi:hypothetical protein